MSKFTHIKRFVYGGTVVTLFCAFIWGMVYLAEHHSEQVENGLTLLIIAIFVYGAGLVVEENYESRQ